MSTDQWRSRASGQLAGTSNAAATPSRAGPRHCGQSCAAALAAGPASIARAAVITNTRERSLIVACSRSFEGVTLRNGLLYEHSLRSARGACAGRPLVCGCRYTTGMKTAVSIPDEIFQKAERLAQRAGRSRSDVYTAALTDYVARHAPDEVTEAMNRVCDQVGDDDRAFVAAAARRVLESVEW